jgi:hypothetical protein
MRYEDEDLRARFAELRDVDRTRITAFHVLRERARTSRPRGRRVLTASLAGIATVVVLAFVCSGRPMVPPAIDPAVPSISTWRAPTDVLLPATYPSSFAAMPSLSASVIDAIIQYP